MSARAVLAADTGGTNARFAIAELHSGRVRFVLQRTYPTRSFPDFEPALATFLGQARSAGAIGPAPPRAAIAIAGPVDANAGRLTNRTAWTVDLHGLREHLGMQARVINDFLAQAHAVAHASPADRVELQAGEP